MQQVSKRAKLSEQATIVDIAACIESLAGSVKTLGAHHCSLLQANKAVIAYAQQTKNNKSQCLQANTSSAAVTQSSS